MVQDIYMCSRVITLPYGTWEKGVRTGWDIVVSAENYSLLDISISFRE